MRKFAVISERTLQICASLAALLFLVSGVVYLYLGRATVTHSNLWRLYEIYLTHSWFESALLKVDNHSLFFPTFLLLADLRFFHGDQQPLFITGLALLFITASLLLTPIWRDETIGLTAKIVATLVVIVGNFWMGRASIIALGGFNCQNSLAMAGAALAFLLLPKMCAGPPRRLLSRTLIVVCAGFLASFSFSAGLAIWPTMLLLAWCLRLPRYSVGLLAVAGLTAAVIFVLLPPAREDLQTPQLLPPVAYIAAAAWLCPLVGSPFSYAVFAWWPDKLSRQLVDSPGLALYAGAVGLVLAVLAVAPQIIHRNVQKSRLEFTGMALIVFTLFALLLVASGRSGFRQLSSALAPRYLFWSTLFWTGLLLVAIQRAESKKWLRWPVYVVALALPVLVFPRQYKDGLGRRNARRATEFAATSLVNGIRDDQQVRSLFVNTGQVYHVAERLRARRLDMFADGLQDWIGVDEASLFGGRHEREGLKGEGRVDALVPSDNGTPSARVVGQASTHGDLIPETLVIVDPAGVVRGVARSAPISRFINRTFYRGRFSDRDFLGYIRDYNPQLKYSVRSADDGILSEETIPVQIPVKDL